MRRCTIRLRIRPTIVHHIRWKRCATHRPPINPTFRPKSTRAPARHHLLHTDAIHTISQVIRLRQPNCTNRDRHHHHQQRLWVQHNRLDRHHQRPYRDHHHQHRPPEHNLCRLDRQHTDNISNIIQVRRAIIPAIVRAVALQGSAIRAAYRDRIWNIHHSVRVQCNNRVQKTSILGLILVATTAATATAAAAAARTTAATAIAQR